MLPNEQPGQPVAGGGTLLGRVLGDFVVREQIGAGAFGVVYRAEQAILGREAIVKTLVRAPNDQERIQRFLREARLASKLDHPFAAHVYAFGAEPGGLLWIAMEYVRGATLADVLKSQGPMPLAQFVPFFERLCEVVGSAHDQGLIHRDIKPANVMVITRAGRVLPKLLDFGIAKLGGSSSGEAPIAPPDAAALGDLAAERLERVLDAAESVELTQEGRSVGSPLYMPPEQWLSPGAADARSDIYALGVVAYECLMGAPPFRGPSMRALARQHASSPVPPLGPDLPSALHDVISRAMSKLAMDRFSSALEFAATLRFASGLSESVSTVPKLTAELRDAFISEAPQPIAEALSALEAARNPLEALRAVETAASTTVRFLALLGLAARARVRFTDAPDPPELVRLTDALRRSRLNDSEWWELARALTAPFASRREMHPLPALVEFFHDLGGGPSAVARDLHGLLGDAGKSTSKVVPEQVLQQLAGRVNQLERVLRSAGLLLDYRLALVSRGVVERWTGLRRPKRPSLPERKSLPDGAILLGAGDEWVLSLSPLFQALPPSPGNPAELFILDGQGRFGARLVSWPQMLERHDEGVWEWCVQHTGLFSMGASDDVRPTKSPYRGLAAFRKEDSEDFFGREREAEAFCNRLRQRPILAVVGPSGSGKSSFVQAGVAPLLTDWVIHTVRPGPTPFAALAEALTEQGLPTDAETLRRDPDSLRELLGRSGQKRVLVVDQFEELITLCADNGERAAYAEALVRVAPDVDAPCRVVITLRDDFLIRVQQLPALRDCLAQALELLGTPAREDLTRILIEPARRAGYAFENRDLIDEMVDAVVDQPGALALLSFAAAQLWNVRDQVLKRLTRRVYDAMGGVAGALAHHAEATLALASPDEARLTREAFRGLVTAEGTRAVLPRRDLLQLLGGGALAESTLERLIQARLLVSEGEGVSDRIEVIHEKLLSSWPRLVQWQREDAEIARLRDQLRAAARQWVERGFAKGVLWRGDALVEYRLWRSRYRGALTDTEHAFAQSSLREEARGRRIRRALTLGAFAVLMVGVALLTRANRRAEASRQQAFESVAWLHFEQGRRFYLAGQPLQALTYLSKAYDEGIASPGIRYLLARTIASASETQVVASGHLSSVFSAEFSEDDRRIVSASDDHTARIWNAQTGRQDAVLQLDHRVDFASFSPGDGRLVLTASEEQPAAIWDAHTGQVVHVLRQGARAPWAEFSHDGAQALTVSPDGFVRLWDVASGELARSFDYGAPLGAAHLNRDGTRLAAIENFRESAGKHRVKVWDPKTGQLLFEVPHQAVLNDVEFSADGSMIVTASADGVPQVWDAVSGHLISKLPVGSAVRRAVFNPTGATIVTPAGFVAILWKPLTGEKVAALEGHTGRIVAAAFSPDGTTLATAGQDGKIRLWNANTGEFLYEYLGHSRLVVGLRFSHDGSKLASASLDRSVRVWEIKRARPLSISRPFYGVAFSADGRELYGLDRSPTLRRWDAVTGAPGEESKLGDGFVFRVSPSLRRALSLTGGSRMTGQVWDLETKSLLATLSGHTASIRDAAFAPDGRWLVTASEDGTARVWDVRTGSLELTFRAPVPMDAVDVSSDSNVIATGDSDGTLTLWNSGTGTALRTIQAHPHAVIMGVRFSADGSKVVTAGADQTARTWDALSGAPLHRFQGHLSPLAFATFDPQGLLIATASLSETTRLWDATSGLELDMHPFGCPEPSSCVAFRPGTSSYAVIDRGHAVVFDASLERRSPAEVHAFVACHVPYRLRGDQLEEVSFSELECPP